MSLKIILKEREILFSFSFFYYIMSFASPEKGTKRKPGLRLTPQHLQLATPSSTSPTNATFRQQLGHIVNGNAPPEKKDVEETSLAASYLAQNESPPKSTTARIEQQQPTAAPATGGENHFMEIKVQDLETLSRLGEGAAGTVRKVLHKPTQLIMAKKVIVLNVKDRVLIFKVVHLDRT
jgi:hypothetical protein